MSERFQIDILDFGGWVRVFLARGEPIGETAQCLSQSLQGWMQNIEAASRFSDSVSTKHFTDHP